jgi:hypothetical protein
MMFARSRAAESLHAVLSVVSRQWSTLDDETRRELEALVRRFGPEVINPVTTDELRPVIGLLDALRVLRDRLPLAALAALDAAWDAPDRFTLRLSADERQLLQEDLMALVDFRVYRDARGFAQRLSNLILANQDRLTPDERLAWRALEEDLKRDGDATVYLSGMEKLLAQRIGFVARAFEAEKSFAEPFRQEMPPDASEIWVDPWRGAADNTVPGLPSVVSRYANVYFPSTLAVTQQSVPLIVHLARRPAADSVDTMDTGEMRVAIGDLTILLHAEDFSLVSCAGGAAVPGLENARLVTVEPERDSEPVVFFLTPRTAGEKRITVEIYQHDRNLRSLGFSVNVVSDPARIGDVRHAPLQAIPVVSARRGSAAPPPDLELRVMLQPGGRTLTYTLHSPGGTRYNHQPVGQVRLADDPMVVLSPLIGRLSTMARREASARTPEETARASAELSDIGNSLFDQLFSPELKDQYRHFREAFRDRSLLITTDEPWIPWELVKPFATDGDGAVLYDDPPLCEMFRVSRWIAGRGAPDFIPIEHGVWVIPTDNLQAAQDESDYFANLHRQQWNISIQGPLETLAEVESRFVDGKTQLFHFACHGNFNADDPGESKLKLAGEFLRPSQIVGRRRAGLQQSKPLVFLNACHSSRVGAGLTGLAGWAQQFIDSGASAFIGSLWEVNDRLAARFSREFYNRLLGLEGHHPLPLGEALHQARMVIRQLDPANPTWLAYVLYGDPYGQAVLGMPQA